MKITIRLWALCALISAQTIDVNALRTLGQSSATKLGLDRTKLTQEKQAQSLVILDQPVDPNLYLVGPGDQFRVNIISSNEAFNYSLTVSPTGEILIPAVAIVPVYGLTLRQAIKAMEKTVKEWNQNVRIYITLEQIREFKVKVIGQLEQPGLYTATPMTRVSDLYQMIIEQYSTEIEEDEESLMERGVSETDRSMMYDQKSQIADLYERKMRVPEEEKEYQELSNRNLVLIRKQDSIKIDLARFGVSGKNDYNPYLQQEDILVIPLRRHLIGIYGGVKIPGKYEYVFGEFLSDLIQIAGGLRPNADPEKIEITRYNGPTEKFSFTVEFQESKDVQLNPEDHVMVQYAKQYKRQEIVYITGEVVHPGVYSILPGQTTIGNILAKASGYTNRSDSSKITINNRDIYEIPDRELERILLIPEENRSTSERAYIKARMMTQKGALETNSIIQAQYIKDFLVAKNDIIHVPENFDYVEILGAVKRPGRYPFIQSYLYDNYIEIAGGITSNATRNKFVIKAGTGQRLPAKNKTKINTGDIIFIAEKMEYNKWIVLKDVLATASQIAVLLFYIDRVTNSG
ncbi:MAG: SLBB domain-containing protein [Candidatus Neomarinimicrobiota bacterium]|nr:SLBB domain-containing protein [Candidatus Neomarinimicrobiota bacterium]